MDGSSSQVCWQTRRVRQVAIYSKVQGTNIVATYRYNTCHICNCEPLLENAAHCIHSYMWLCGTWPDAGVILQAAPEKGLTK